jgi:hypothetical protein
MKNKTNINILFIILLFNFSTIYTKFLNDLYHTTDEIFQEFDKLANGNCNYLKKDYLKEKENQMTYFTIDKAQNQEHYSTSVMIFGEHSRELLSPEQALFLVKVLCKVEPNFDDDETIDAILSQNKIILVPIVNVYGRKIVEQGNYCKRTNEHNVDLNRNWASHWDATTHGEEQSPGDKPFSEWQTRVLRDLILKIKPDIFISTHAGTLGMYTPYAYKKYDFKHITSENGKKLSKMLQIVKTVNTKYCNCKAGSIGNELWYLCPGTCLDYSFEELKVKYTFAFEIYDGETKNSHFLNIINDPSPKKFKYKEFIKDYNNDLSLNFLIQMNSSLDGGKNLRKGNQFNFMEKFSYYKDKNFEYSCFSQIKLQDTDNENCKKQMNPLTGRHFRNTLINWLNVYFELFSLVYQLENNHNDFLHFDLKLS